MAVNDSDLVGVAGAAFENHAPLIVHPERVEILEITLQLFEPIREQQLCRPLRGLHPTAGYLALEAILCRQASAALCVVAGRHP